MGEILPADVEGRDAVHVAVIAVTAGHWLQAGDHVAVYGAEPKLTALAEDGDGTVGIVDPFLSKKVKKGERFWLYLYPRTITALSHKWSHPAFDGMEKAKDSVYAVPNLKLKSEQWLRDFTDRTDCPGYERLMELIANEGIGKEGRGCRNDGEYLHIAGSSAYGAIPREFWDHVEIVLGNKIPDNKRATYFTCSC
jgi:hypothetical protein